MEVNIKPFWWLWLEDVAPRSILDSAGSDDPLTSNALQKRLVWWGFMFSQPLHIQYTLLIETSLGVQ